MAYLSEDPTFLAGAFAVLAGLFVIALKTTQQGKYLLGAATCLVLALGVVVVEWVWVTDSERIEKVVYDVRTAVLNGDADEVLAHLAPKVMYQHGETASRGGCHPSTDPCQREQYPPRLCPDQRVAHQRRSANAEGSCRVPCVYEGEPENNIEPERRLDDDDILVAGFPGNRTRSLENHSNQCRLHTDWHSCRAGWIHAVGRVAHRP